jgi:isoleucyl-tRNA synthetase
VLDAAVTPALEAEGLARDLVRAIQQARRDAGLSVSDRISLTIDAPESVTAAARAHEALIRSETLALQVAYVPVADGIESKVGDGTEVKLGIVPLQQ